jgi:DNA-binding transcriptional MerR regulator
MKSGDLVKLLRLPESTLRKYAQEYSDYLSPSNASRHREYTEHDARVLKLIMDMKAEKVSGANIEVTLSSLQSGDWQQLPPLDRSTAGIIPTEQNLVAAQQDLSALKREAAIFRELYEQEKGKNEETARKLAEAELLVKLYESGRLKPGN